ncbi:hypothetical protein L3556_11730 [Candidatus Synechococcus calcipolaris G9]|uniref:Uncharacterized protein n=1 Tax=Candidatus Synechococcus calcipolaris G9 TaxID=1497997 RepID=A0ABT6F196_9SYNE|nr:hypothetical protein [Candidatus Synechococcus calcipolaris]MDG2991595.1 hypothetical protein [Candidatus Synechococcus calcipolaris G9]
MNSFSSLLLATLMMIAPAIAVRAQTMPVSPQPQDGFADSAAIGTINVSPDLRSALEGPQNPSYDQYQMIQVESAAANSINQNTQADVQRPPRARLMNVEF